MKPVLNNDRHRHPVMVDVGGCSDGFGRFQEALEPSNLCSIFVSGAKNRRSPLQPES
jgi:hypothetical protein